MTSHSEQFLQLLRALPQQAPPAPWQKPIFHRVGGLQSVGYAEESDLLLVVSTDGRGVFDCLAGEKVARDLEDYHLNEVKLTATGIGPLAERTIRVAGLFGGGLPITTHDAWELEAVQLEWPDHSVFLSSPGKSIYTNEGVKIGDNGACTLMAYGFSETGRSFIIATSCALVIFNRP